MSRLDRLARLEAVIEPRKVYIVHGQAQHAAVLARLTETERKVAQIVRLEWIAPSGATVENWIGLPDQPKDKNSL